MTDDNNITVNSEQTETAEGAAKEAVQETAEVTAEATEAAEATEEAATEEATVAIKTAPVEETSATEEATEAPEASPVEETTATEEATEAPEAAPEEAGAEATAEPEEKEAGSDDEQDEKEAQNRAAEALRKQKRALLKAAREALRSGDYDPYAVDQILAQFDAQESSDPESLAEKELAQQREEIASRNEAKKKRRADQAVSVEKKLALIKKAEELRDSEEWKKTAEAFKTLMDEWRAAGNSGSEGDKLWEQFSAARQAFFDRQRKHYSDLDAQNEARKKEKESIISEAKEAADSTEWGKAHERLEELFAKWKGVGAAGRDEERLWAEFQSVRHSFYERRTAARREQEQIFEVRREDKEALIKQAQAYLDDADYSAEAASRMREMGSDWKDIGFCGRKQENELWERFHGIQDAYWQGKKANGNSRHEEWIEKTKGAIERRRDRAERLKDNIENLKARIETASEEKRAQIEGWIAENEEQISSLEAEIEKMEKEISE